MIGIKEGIDFVLHIDIYLGIIIQNYGAWVYGFLFLIILLETGLVVTPFLPGDSLLFVAGVFSANGEMNIIFLVILLSVAAIIGDSMNYSIGKYIGKKAFADPNSKIFRREYLEKTERFYDKYGSNTIILARFIPIVRTFAPFIAGVGKMKYSKFLSYNVIGGIVWVSLFSIAGYLFGNVPIIKENPTWVIFIIIGISIMPAVIEYIKHRRD